MRIISQTKLKAFWQTHPDSRVALLVWYRATELVFWASPVEVANRSRNADTGGEFISFNICRNDYRLVVRADYQRGILYVWDVYTHREYDRLDFKAIDEAIRNGTNE